MQIAAKILICIVALEHILFLVLEMFLWESPFVIKAFNMTPEQAAASATLAMNQGLYNGFLSAGLIWAVFGIQDKDHRLHTATFFLCCIIIAGIFGGLTAKFSIIFTQGMPAFIALILLWLGKSKSN